MDVFIVDTFTNRPYSGNPAAVCIIEKPLVDELMQSIASELNLSETSFLFKENPNYNLRWFTPTTEVDLCGHATLASAHILWETGLSKKNDEIIFSTRGGELSSRKNGPLIEMDFPKLETQHTIIPEELLNQLKMNPVYIGKTRFDYLVEVNDEELVKNYKPKFELIKRLDSRGLIVTSSAESKDYDFVSRFFAPQVGILEDPVTGSAHCSLGPYWSEKIGKSNLTGFQASERGGYVYVNTLDNKVTLSGNAVTVFKGRIQ